MFYDLNVPWTAGDLELQRTLAFLHERYNVIALTHTLSGKLPSDLTCPIPHPLPFPVPPTLRLLRRCTLVLSTPSQNHRLADLTRPSSGYDLLALRPTDASTLQQACASLDCDLISLDLTRRLDAPFKFRTLAQAVQRGVRFEISYAPALLASDGGGGGPTRRNLISNATQLVRATRGRGIVVSSEASRALGCRGPWDVMNLAAVWGLGQERGFEAVSAEARGVVVAAGLKRTGYRGVVDVVYGGEKPVQKGRQKQGQGQRPGEEMGGDAGKKRKADAMSKDKEDGVLAKQPSKRELKRQARRARLETEGGAREKMDTDDATKEPVLP